MESFDYVIVGAGAAGCVLANRLGQEPGVSICVLEAGGRDSHPYIRIPAGFVKTLYGDRLTWSFMTAPGDGIAGRQIRMPQGKVLGGSSSVNGMVYNRGQRADFDTWAQYGNRGWGFEDLLPYFKRSERRIGVADQRLRGVEGETPITDCDWLNPLCEAFIAAAGSLGIPRNPDYNAGTQFGAGYYQRFIHRGRRVSAADAFLRPALRRGGVVVRDNAQVSRIEFDGLRATGLRYRRGDGEEQLVQARREVLLCAGAANSPKLLQLSGVGSPALLGELGITVKHPLSGVGENLRDHYSARMVARARNVRTINEYARWPRLPVQFARWLMGRPSVLGLSPSVAYVHGKSHPDLEDADLRILFTPGSYKEGRTYVLDDYPGMTCGAAQPRPESTGFVRISSPDPADPPIIQPNYLTAEIDQQITLIGLRLARRILNAPPMAAYLDHETLPGASATSDDELLDFARRNGNTGYHLVGTCRMGPAHDQRSVVDDELRVHGIERLRVVDASIMPMLPSANTYASTLAIAEKAADLIRGIPAPGLDAA
ncbi:MAG: GMC family oxidoreductase N-terminal domain-containing protein [Gammaproteobacteria bacterium]|nr:GMC family oxidoreductase N-terminal domain-containing protein [Gammaproteobacteria bacterium]